jgi:WD40 repeat protein
MQLYEDHKAVEERDHKGVVYSIAFSPDGSTLVTAGKDGALYLRDASGERVTIIEREPNTHSVHSVVYAMDGSLVVGGGFGWCAYRQNREGSWQISGPLKATPTNSLAILNENTLVVGTGDRNLPTVGACELWDLSTGRRNKPEFPEPNGVRAVAVCPSRRMVAWATRHMAVRVRETIKQNTIVFNQLKNCPALAFNPEGTILAAAVDWVVKLINIEKRYDKLELKGHRGSVNAVAFSPDGATIATGSGDRTVKLWDAATGRERATFKWPIGRVYCLAFAPDGLRIAAGGDEGSIVVWDMD